MEHHMNWGLPVAVDLFTAALGAGAFMLAVIADLIGGRRNRTVSFVGAVIAPWPVILGVLLLVIDLGNPQRFWEMLLRVSPDGGLEAPFLMFNVTSTMSIGTWTLTIFVWLSIAYLLLHVLSYPYRPLASLRKLVGVAGLPIALMVTIYTGVLLSASPNTVWNNLILPIVFMCSALTTGIAIVVLVLTLLRMIGTIDEDSAHTPLLEKIMGRIMLVQVAAMILFVIASSSASIGAMFSGTLSGTLWILLLGIGLVIPLLLTVRKGKALLPVTAVVAVLLVIEGILFLAEVIKTGSMIVPIVFFCSAMVAGIVTELLIVTGVRMRSKDLDDDEQKLKAVNKITTRIMIVQAAVAAIIMIAAAGLPAVATSQMGAIMFVFVIGLGLAVPLMMTVRGDRTWSPATSALIALLVLEGGFFLRYVILVAGQV